MSYILIIGAKSDIAKAVAKEYGKHGYNLFLASRDAEELKDFASDITIRYKVIAECVELDILDYPSHDIFYKRLHEKPLGVISAVGYLGEQDRAQSDFNESQKIINTNFTGIVSLFNIIADDFQIMRNGFIIGISSVAGERGRKSNYLYGSAKAALSVYLSGLRNRLNDFNVHVLTVKPGFVKTKMTESLMLPAILTAQAEEVARDIFKAQQKGKNVLYTKWIWRFIMIAIKSIPEWKFKRMSI